MVAPEQLLPEALIIGDKLARWETVAVSLKGCDCGQHGKLHQAGVGTGRQAMHAVIRCAVLLVKYPTVRMACPILTSLSCCGCWGYVCCDCSLPAGAVAKVLKTAQAAETVPLDKGLELER